EVRRAERADRSDDRKNESDLDPSERSVEQIAAARAGDHDDRDDERDLHQRRADEKPTTRQRIAATDLARPPPNQASDRRDQRAEKNDRAEPEDDPVERH